MDDCCYSITKQNDKIVIKNILIERVLTLEKHILEIDRKLPLFNIKKCTFLQISSNFVINCLMQSSMAYLLLVEKVTPIPRVTLLPHFLK